MCLLALTYTYYAYYAYYTYYTYYTPSRYASQRDGGFTKGPESFSMCGRAEAIAQWLDADEECMVHARRDARLGHCTGGRSRAGAASCTTPCSAARMEK